MRPKRSRRGHRARGPSPGGRGAASGGPVDGQAVQPGGPGRGATGPDRPTQPRPGRTRADGRTRRREAPPPRGSNRSLIALVAVAALGLAALALVVPRLSGPGGTASATATTSASGGTPESAAAFGVDCPTSQPPPLVAGEQRRVAIETPQGPIVIEVDGSLGPNAAGNFVALAGCGYYDNVVFHRIAPGFVIQGGDGQYGRLPNVDLQRVGSGGPGYQFPNDPVSVTYDRGVVAMANAGVDTNGSQFFICLSDITTLPPNYSVFGRVVEGMETVDAIAAMPNQEQRALDPVPMTQVTVAG